MEAYGFVKELVDTYIHGTYLLTPDMSIVREMVAVAAATGGGMRAATVVVLVMAALVKCSSSTCKSVCV